MLNESYIQTSVLRLNETISRRYGCQIQFLSPDKVFAQLNFTPFKNNTADSIFHKGEYLEIGADVFIPLYVNNRFVGAAQILNQTRIAEASRQNIFAFVALVFETRLEFISEQNDIQNPWRDTANSSPSNVVVLKNASPLTLQNKNHHPVENKIATDSPFIFSFLLESKSSDDLFKMALEIHDRTHRLAFVRFSDLDPATFRTPADIEALGNITVFIEDLSQVPHAIQRVMMQYFDAIKSAGEDQATNRERPQFISGTSLSRSELRNDPRVFNELIPALSKGYLLMAEPFSFYRSEKLLDFFFDCLTGQNLT